MARLLLILVVAAVAFTIVAVVDCAVQPSSRHRGVSKAAWLFIVILLPVIGGILWFVIGRGRGDKQRSPRYSPDDDPAFLESAGILMTDAQEDRIRRLEEELARLDAEEAAEKDAPDATGPAPDGPAPAPSPDEPRRDDRRGGKPDDGDEPREPRRGRAG